MNAAEATRELYWNISHVWVMYALLLPTLAIFSYGVYRHVILWRRGLPLERFDRPADRIRLLLKHAVAQSRTARDVYSGLFHRMIFYSFLVLAAATTVVALQADLGIHVMHGWFYLYFQSLIVDVFGALLMVGTGMAAARRFLARPKRLVYTDEAAWMLAVFFVIAGTGFLIEGLRIAATNDPWAAWSPFGNVVAQLCRPHMSVAAMETTHRTTWWFHMLLSFGFLAWIPFTKMMHMVSAPLNIYASNLDPIGASLKNIDFENTEAFGVNSFQGFTWKDLLDLDACTECGRCTDVCPANTVGKELSPRDIILELRNLMRNNPGAAFGVDQAAKGEDSTSHAKGMAIIGAVPATSPLRLWQCTTCAACVEVCPVFIEQMPKIVDMRRHLVMEEAEFPESMQECIMSLESRGHPFRGTQATRLDWTEGLNVPQIQDGKDVEVLLWVGCSGALIERNQKIIRATAQLLSLGGVKFGILGREEQCCGDPARRIGNEFLFEKLAKESVSILKKYQVKKIVTTCPHCFNTVKNEYPRHGGDFEVHHHSEFLAKLVDEGRLKPVSESGKKIAFHDPCYLGRQNGVFDEPRQLVNISAGRAQPEMSRSGASSFCCGGGGGMSFVEEPTGQRVNQERAREALESGADVLAVACPFCMTMMEDGVNALKGERDVSVMDVSELLLQTMI
jgi:Fe-S oxidoreductase/nitrate reductase gamma subunit